ncbi:hypothetical protein A2U01_0044182, partial [Trifolium medium]|nr:hypothetical protein [Trifolium medium]
VSVDEFQLGQAAKEASHQTGALLGRGRLFNSGDLQELVGLWLGIILAPNASIGIWNHFHKLSRHRHP